MNRNGSFQKVNTLEVGAGRDKMATAIVQDTVRFSVFYDFCFLAIKD